MGVLWVPSVRVARLLFVYELCRVRRLRREALPLPDFSDERIEHVRRHRLPELEVGVPDRLSCGGSSHHLAQVEGLGRRNLPLDYRENLLLPDVDELSALAADNSRDGPD